MVLNFLTETTLFQRYNHNQDIIIIPFRFLKFGKEKIGLYRDDGLSCFQNMTGPQAERVKKKICEIFQSCGLKITIETNLQIMDVLDVTFNLKNEKYYPFRKSSNYPLYINALSNHPKNIIKEISNMIAQRISEIFFGLAMFCHLFYDFLNWILCFLYIIVIF